MFGHAERFEGASEGGQQVPCARVDRLVCLSPSLTHESSQLRRQCPLSSRWATSSPSCRRVTAVLPLRAARCANTPHSPQDLANFLGRVQSVVRNVINQVR
jgi:hypothetical protein